MSFCCGAKVGKRRLQETIVDVKAKVARHHRRLKMNDDQIYEFTERFESLAVNKFMSLKSYKESLGLIGTDSLSFMADRMFAVMDEDKDGMITLDEYLCYIDVMLYGSEEEKRKQSFGLLDKRGNGMITFDDFKSIVQSFAQMWSAALGTPVPLNLKYFQRIFNEIAVGKPHFNLQDFQRYMEKDPDALTWFQKPELALQQRVNDYKNKKQKEKQELIDQIGDLKDKVAQHLDSFQSGLCFSLDVLDPRYHGNARNILIKDEGNNPSALGTFNNAGPQSLYQGSNGHSLDMIGETPNPDDEETLRFPQRNSIISEQQQVLQKKMTLQSEIAGGAPGSSRAQPMIVEEVNQSSERQLLKQQTQNLEHNPSLLPHVTNEQEGFAMPSLSSKPKHFIKMQNVGGQKENDWIGRRITELKQRHASHAPISQQAASNLLFTGHQDPGIEVEFPRASITQALVAKKAMNSGGGANEVLQGRSRPNQNIPRSFLFSKNNHNEFVPEQCSDYEDQYHRSSNLDKQYSEALGEDTHKLNLEPNNPFAKSAHHPTNNLINGQMIFPSKTPQAKSSFVEISQRNMHSERQTAPPGPQGNQAPMPFERQDKMYMDQQASNEALKRKIEFGEKSVSADNQAVAVNSQFQQQDPYMSDFDRASSQGGQQMLEGGEPEGGTPAQAPQKQQMGDQDGVQSSISFEFDEEEKKQHKSSNQMLQIDLGPALQQNSFVDGDYNFSRTQKYVSNSANNKSSKQGSKHSTTQSQKNFTSSHVNAISAFQEQGPQPMNPMFFRTTTGRSQKINSIHKQDKQLPGNFYYLKSKDEKLLDFHPDNQSQENSVAEQQQMPAAELVFSGRHNSSGNDLARGPDMMAAAQEINNRGSSNIMVNQMLSFSSQGHDESPSSNNSDNENFDMALHHPGKKDKSLIERYKTLELLMKKKKMMAQIEATHSSNHNLLRNASTENNNIILNRNAAKNRVSNALLQINEQDDEEVDHHHQLFNQSHQDTEERDIGSKYHKRQASVVKVSQPKSPTTIFHQNNNSESGVAKRPIIQVQGLTPRDTTEKMISPAQLQSATAADAQKTVPQGKIAGFFSSFMPFGGGNKEQAQQEETELGESMQQLLSSLPDKPIANHIISPSNLHIKFDESPKSGISGQRNSLYAQHLPSSQQQNDIATAAALVAREQEDADVANDSDEQLQLSILAQAHQLLEKKVKDLELELAIAENRLKIGSKLIKNLVMDTKDSMTYFMQQFDIITKQSSNVKKGGLTRQYQDSAEVKKRKQEFQRQSVMQNVHFAVREPKLIKKKKSNQMQGSLMVATMSAAEINKNEGREGRPMLLRRNDGVDDGQLALPDQPIKEIDGGGELGVDGDNQQIVKFDLKDLKTDKPSKIEKPMTRNFVHPAHHNFNMVFNIMLGIKMSVDATLDYPMFTPTDKDYKIRCEFGVAPYKTDNSDSLKACAFYDYAPKIFASIRKFSGISKEQYLESLGPEKILGYMFKSNFQTLSELCSSGKSGSFFYYSYDGRFMLKTIPRHEFKMMKGMLKNYHEYLTEKNTDSMICRTFGLHKVIFYRKGGKMKQKIYFCIMNNIFQTTKKIDLRYDLKGSTYGRQTIKDKNGIMVDRTVSLKDLDFLAKKDVFKVGSENRAKILEILRQDAQFFADNNIIDYSLLVGVHNKAEHPSTFMSRRNSLGDQQMQFDAAGTPVEDDQSALNTLNAFDMSVDCFEENMHFYQQFEGGLLSSDKEHIYFMGVIDIFTGYTIGKKFEHFGKSIYQNRHTISCVPPQRYAQRFVQFLQTAFR